MQHPITLCSPAIAYLAAMKAAVADKRIVKRDGRDVDAWIGESSSPYGKDFCPRKGRMIPGSVWIESLVASRRRAFKT